MALALSTCLVLLGLAFLIYKRFTRKPAGVKYPTSLPSLPFIGSLLFLRNQKLPHVFFKSLQEKYGSLYSLKMGSQYTVIVNNHKHAKEVLLKKGKIFAGRPRAVTTDILTRDGKDIAFGTYSSSWKFHRKLVHSALCMFGEGSLAIQNIICREAAAMIEALTNLQDNWIDMAPELTRAVTNVVCSLCFSFSIQKRRSEFESMLLYSQGIVDNVAKDSLIDIFPWLKIFPNKDLDVLKKSVKMRDTLLLKKLEEHKEAYRNDKVNDLMDALLNAKLNMETKQQFQEVGLTDDYLLMTVGDIFGAGVETTTTVLKWAIAYLLYHPEVQRKIQEELDTKIGFERHPLLSDRKNLPFLEATISEVLRMRPVSPLLIPHVALEESSIGEYTIAKGTRVVINLWSLHHDEKEWKNPDTFDPGRFLDEQGNHVYSPSPSYIPFGAGIRVCLGEALAKMELFLFLSWILQAFTLETTDKGLPDLEGKWGVVLQVNKYAVKVKPRKVS
ncbi:steroid 17-alpha-hydroxylase/17,20 lyase [Microcaecilia unicolor]|uniref:Steroid 17-alpha-hydroxylase/17,20 lyase n=1 Tax=Microcaecilia unicolor TaxID=1415580 RepID=A0A6P7XTB6_9AMPH|nr:steroid 17-alpha-hydroxylase/17,20 lyase [Microcaecilia unicolor]